MRMKYSSFCVRCRYRPLNRVYMTSHLWKILSSLHHNLKIIRVETVDLALKGINDMRGFANRHIVFVLKTKFIVWSCSSWVAQYLAEATAPRLQLRIYEAAAADYWTESSFLPTGTRHSSCLLQDDIDGWLSQLISKDYQQLHDSISCFQFYSLLIII